MAIGEVKAKLTLDNAQFNAGMQQSGQIASNTGALTEKAAAKARAAFEKEQIAADRLSQKLAEVARQKQLTALKADILARSENAAAGAADELGESFNRAGHAGVSQMQAASASIRLIEGGLNNNIRAVERFVTSLPGVGAAFQAIFPIAGGIAFAGVLVRVGSELYKTAQNVTFLRDAIKGLQQEQIAVDRRRQSAADSVESSVEGMLEKTQGRGAALQQRETYQRQKPLDLSEYFYSDEVKKLPDDVKGSYERMYKSVAPEDAPAKLAAITREVNDLKQALVDIKDPSKTAFGMLPAVGGFRPETNKSPEKYYTARLLAAQQIQSDLESASSERTASIQGIQVDETDQARQDADERTRKAKQAAAEAKRARDEAYRTQMAGFEQNLSDIRQTHQLQIGEEEQFWRSMRARTGQGSLAWLDVNKRIGTAHQETLRQLAARTKEDDNELARALEGQGRGASMFRQEAVKNSDRTYEAARETNSADVLQAQNEAREREASLTDEAGRSITRYNAAMAVALSHALEYRRVRQDLMGNVDLAQRQLDQDPQSEERYKQLMEAREAVSKLDSQRSVQVGKDRDSASGYDTSAIVGVTDALDEFARSARDAAGEMREFVFTTLGSLNRTLTDVLTAPRHHERHYVRNQFRDLGRGVATNVTGMALSKGEGALLGAFGLGTGKKPAGDRSNPFFVTVTNFGAVPGGGGGALSSILSGTTQSAAKSSGGGVLEGIGNALIGALPAFAEGGAIDAGTMSLVGERGPELFLPKSAGTIIPNNKMGSVGGTTHHWNIDARGAHDAAQVEAAVHRGIRQAAPSLVSSSLRAMHETQRRRPSSAR